jgi:hypothetical protein
MAGAGFEPQPWLRVGGSCESEDMMTGRAAPATPGKEERKVNDEQTDERDATGHFVRSRVVRTARRANDIVCVRAWLGRICSQKLSRRSEIVIGNLDAHATDGVGIEPVHLHDMLVQDKCRNASRFQAGAEQVCFLGLAKGSDRFHQ